MRNIIYIIGCICFMAVSFLASCSKESATDKMPVITGVRAINPALADSTFTECDPGTNIILMGRNLGSTYEIYINDQKVPFQGTYVTDNNILLTVPSEIKLTGTDPQLKDEIRVVTREGVAVYPFHINAEACTISAMEADFPLSPGQEMVLIGTNFIDVEQVYYTSVDPDNTGDNVEDKEWWEIADEQLQQGKSRTTETSVEKTELEYRVGDEFTKIYVTLPATLVDEGWIVVRTHTGQASIILYSNAMVPKIEKINSDMPVIGSTVKIDGEGFIGIYNIVIGNDEIIIPVSDIEVTSDGKHLEFVMPEAPKYGGTLTIRTCAGSGEIPFYNVDAVIADMDGKGAKDWGGALSVEGDGTNPPYVTTGVCLGIDAPFDLETNKYYWGNGRLAFKNIVMPSTIPDGTDISKLEVRYEGYYVNRFVHVNFNFQFEPGESISHNTPESIYTGEMVLDEWATYSIPVKDIVPDGVTNYSEWVDVQEKDGGSVVFHAVSNPDGVEEYVHFYIDNVRIYVKE